MADTITKVVTVDVSGAVKSLKEMREEVESSGYTFKSLGEAKKYIDLLRASLLQGTGEVEQGDEGDRKYVEGRQGKL